MTIPPIAVESAKEALHRLLELCMTDAPPLDKGEVRRHVLDGLEALTDEDDPEDDRDLPIREVARRVFTTTHPVVRDALTGAQSLQLLHERAGCRCVSTPVTPPVVCRECREGKCPNCDGEGWDDALDAPAPCTCDHPKWGQPEWTPEQIEKLRVALTEPVPVHACPRGDSALTPCCGRSPFTMLNERMTLDPSLVTCKGPKP